MPNVGSAPGGYPGAAVAPRIPPRGAPGYYGGAVAERKEEDASVVEPPPITSVAFWGICDIKYDPRLPQRDRVRVLELGDGRSSRFSHHGKVIKEKFDREYRMDPTPIKRAVMTENKKFTHDMFVQEGFAHLRPPTACYPRRYHARLAGQVAADLNLRSGTSLVVLKLANRCRGAGIVVTSLTELDNVLKVLLTPPEGRELEEWLKERAKNVLQQDFVEILDEQKLHWWSNECPLFVVERCCASQPVPMEGSREVFDGTMRVAFALHRKLDPVHDFKVLPFDIDWLGGYWKLPPSATKEAAEQGSLEDMHATIVSSFNSVEKRTAEVPPQHLQEIYDALTPALPRIFHSGGLSVMNIMSAYKDDALFRAFALSRVAASMRVREIVKAEGLFDLARKMVPSPTTWNAHDLPERSVLSYIDRNVGVCWAMKQNWKNASQKFRASIDTMPTNSTAYYLEACCCLEDAKHASAVENSERAIALDPDYKGPYIILGSGNLHLRKYELAMEASLACLRRHPDAPPAGFNMGQAIYHLMQGHPVSGQDPDEMCDKAREHFDIAKKRHPEHWSAADEQMRQYFSGEDQESTRNLPVHTWRTYVWRP